jgi:tRNA(Ile)-lysidine synthase
MPHPLELKLASAWPPEEWQEVTVLLAVSGGADSVAMLQAMTALKTAGEGRLVVAHVNHRLRGAESDADETLVAELCRRLEVACEVGSLPVNQSAAGAEGIETRARRLRYAFLQQAAARLGARYVVTAHTADDQAETILHRIVRGTGVLGLGGIARARRLGPATLLRPLLGVRRAELAAYLDDLGQPYRQDSSNLDLRFTRNRIRHRLLPQLAAHFNANVVDALLRLGTLAGEAQAVIDRLVEDLLEQYAPALHAHAVQIDCAGLAGQPRYVVRELLMRVWRRQNWPLQAMGFDEWDLLADMLLCAGGTASDIRRKKVFPGGVTAETAEGLLRVSR